MAKHTFSKPTGGSDLMQRHKKATQTRFLSVSTTPIAQYDALSCGWTNDAAGLLFTCVMVEDCGHIFLREGIVGVTHQQARLSHCAVAHHHTLQHDRASPVCHDTHEIIIFFFFITSTTTIIIFTLLSSDPLLEERKEALKHHFSSSQLPRFGFE